MVTAGRLYLSLYWARSTKQLGRFFVMSLRWGQRVLQRHAIASAVVAILLCILIWRSRVPLVANLANLYWLRAALAGPDMDALAQSDRLLAVTQRWSDQDPGIGFQRGIIAWERGDSASALALWQANMDDERLALYVRGQEQIGSGVEISQTLVASFTEFHTLYACLQVLMRSSLEPSVLLTYDLLQTAWPNWEQRLIPGEEPAAYTHWELGRVHFRNRDNARALNHFLLARQAYAVEHRASLDGAIGICYYRLGQWSAAETYLRRTEDDFFASLAWAHIASEANRWETARLGYERAARQRPSDLRPWLGLAQTYERLGQPDQAQAATDTVERIKAQTP